MRFLVTLSVPVLLLALACSPACADCWYGGCIVSTNVEGYGSSGEFGVDASSSDGYDVHDTLIVHQPSAYAGTYHINGVDGWTGPTGFYGSDFRSPLPLTVGSSYTWRFYVWADPTASGSQIVMDVAFLVRAPAGISGSVTLVGRPAGVDSGPSVGTVWDVNQPVLQRTFLPMFKSADGREGYIFDLTTTVIPEPSSLADLACGLAGVGGFAIRRRR